MIRATGELTVTTRYGVLGSIESEEYDWKGGNIAYYSSFTEHKQGELIVAGPYRLRVLEWSIDWLAAAVVRESAFWPLLVYRVRLGRIANVAYRRLVVTAAVWGLARFTEYKRYPTWRDVYVLDALAKRLHR